jgi:hypothetical protein
MESIVKDHIITRHMMSNGIMTEKQFGFVDGRSCKTNLLDCLNDWTTALDNH